MAFFDFLTAGQADGDSNGSLFTRIKDAFGNDVTRGNREKLPSNQEGLMVMGKNDDVATFIRTDRKGNLISGNYIPELQEVFEGAVVNVQKWLVVNVLFVPAQTTLGGYNFNNTNLTTAAAVAILTSLRQFLKLPRVPLQLKTRLRANIYTNSFADFGFGIPSGTTMLVPNGACIRIVNGNWFAVLTFNSVEIAVANIVGPDGVTQFNTANASPNFYTCDLLLDDDNLVAIVQDTQTGEMVGSASVPVPLTAAKMFGATALPVYYRVVNTTAPSTAPVLTVTEMQVVSMDWRLTPDMKELAGSLGLSAGRQPFTGVQNENHTNSTAPVSATLSNTAAGYTTLGGKFQFAAVAGAVTDYALFGFQVPAGARFLCEGIRIVTRNTGAAVATTPTTLEWAAGFNSSAVSLATANIIRRQLGHQTFAIGAAVEDVAPDIDVDFTTPEVVESGRFLHVILTVPVGTATATEIFRGQVMIKGRFI